ncbi:MAG: GrpB family protein [Candidatus Peribacteria bacterium]|nr:GrpB family protein [Candidatus Peribacteria bacterium]
MINQQEDKIAVGLKRGTVELAEHDPRWSIVAKDTIELLRHIFGDIAVDIQHVGSTSIKDIKAKPIIDIVVAVNDFLSVLELIATLEKSGFINRPWKNDSEMLFACGDYSHSQGIQTHYIHVVKADSKEWYTYICFRDYLNARPDIAKQYEAIKIELANKNRSDKGREKYITGKSEFIAHILQKAQVCNCLRNLNNR